MGKDILSEYGKDMPESSQAMGPRATGGGQLHTKPLAYSPPKGPSNINDGRSPGLHGENFGNCGTQHE